MQPFKLGDSTFGIDKKPLLIAEIGSNHDQDLDTALSLIKAAADCGFDVAKFQSLNFNEMYHQDSQGTGFHTFFKKIELKECWYDAIAKCCRKNNILFMTSVAYESAIGPLLDVGVDLLKVASPQFFADTRLVEKILSTEKPTILSTGYCEFDEVIHLSKAFGLSERQNVCLLHCISQYPSQLENQNLTRIKTFGAELNIPIGFSDHTIGFEASMIAACLGASVIEKHVTFDRTNSGPDHAFALEMSEAEQFISNICKPAIALATKEESLSEETFKYRSDVELVWGTKTKIPQGDEFDEHNTCLKRSVTGGISESELPNLHGFRALKALPEGKALSWDDLQRNV